MSVSDIVYMVKKVFRVNGMGWRWQWMWDSLCAF